MMPFRACLVRVRVGMAFEDRPAATLRERREFLERAAGVRFEPGLTDPESVMLRDTG